MMSTNSTKSLLEIFDVLKLSNDHLETYLKLLKDGKSTTTKIAKYSPIPRTTFYNLLEDLIDWGFVEKELINKKTYYQCTNPQNILKQIQTHKNRCDELTYNLKENLYQLENIYHVNLAQLQKNISQNDDFVIDEAEITKILTKATDIKLIINSQNNDTLLMLDSVLDIAEKSCKSIKELIFSSTKEYLEERKKSKVSKVVKIIKKSNSILDTIKIISNSFLITISQENYLIIKKAETIYYENEIFDLLWKDTKLLKYNKFDNITPTL